MTKKCKRTRVKNGGSDVSFRKKHKSRLLTGKKAKPHMLMMRACKEVKKKKAKDLNTNSLSSQKLQQHDTLNQAIQGLKEGRLTDQHSWRATKESRQRGLVEKV